MVGTIVGMHGQTERVQSLVVESIKKCKRYEILALARYEQETPTKEGSGQCATKERNLALYEQEKLTKENDGQCKLKEKKTMELHKIKSFYLHTIQACNNF